MAVAKNVEIALNFSMVSRWFLLFFVAVHIANGEYIDYGLVILKSTLAKIFEPESFCVWVQLCCMIMMIHCLSRRRRMNGKARQINKTGSNSVEGSHREANMFELE